LQGFRLTRGTQTWLTQRVEPKDAPSALNPMGDLIDRLRTGGFQELREDPLSEDGEGERAPRLRHPSSLRWRCSCPCPETVGSYVDDLGVTHVVAVHCYQELASPDWGGHGVVDHAVLLYLDGTSNIMDIVQTYPDAMVTALAYFDEQRQFFRAAAS
jgi:hypothetical protein